MAEFVNPFIGIIPNRELNKEELIRAVRLDIAAEEEAVHLYKAQADACSDERARELLISIANEEIVHVGEFQKLLEELSPEEVELINKGKAEAGDRMLSIEQGRAEGVFPNESKKGQMKMNIFEAMDLTVYKKLLKVLGEYSDKFPGTGVSRMFDQALESGKKILPKDKLAIEILHFILKTNSVASAIHKILNLRFSNLPIEYRPLVKNGRSKQVAHWTRETLVSDKIKDLIDWKGVGKKGYWSTVDGDKVKLYDLSQEENNV